MTKMKLTAHQLVVIIDTLNQSLVISNWSGVYTHKSREDVRNLIAAILGQMSVEVVTDKAELPGDCQGGYLK
jgi:hypothetical protein